MRIRPREKARWCGEAARRGLRLSTLVWERIRERPLRPAAEAPGVGSLIRTLRAVSDQVNAVVRGFHEGGDPRRALTQVLVEVREVAEAIGTMGKERIGDRARAEKGEAWMYLRLYVKSADEEWLRQAAAGVDLPVSSYVRACLEGQEIVRREERRHYLEAAQLLGRIRANLHQLERYALGPVEDDIARAVQATIAGQRTAMGLKA